MGYFTCKKGQPVVLSEHFKSTEFDCHGNMCCAETRVNETLVEYLEKIRLHFNKPITISSGYRCPVHNKSVGGATKSRHAMGDAADIIVKGIPPREVAKYAESIGILGIGLYETSKDGHFVHIDVRSAKAFWYGQAQEKRVTFGGEDTSGSVSNIEPAKDNPEVTLLKLGSKGDLVKTLQQKLILLNYSCGKSGADGVYGISTVNAVRQFQAHNGLVNDGIAGKATHEALDAAVAGIPTEGDIVYIRANLLNVRAGAGTNYRVVGTVNKNSKHTLKEVKGYWGRISNPAGWISLQYCGKQ